MRDRDNRIRPPGGKFPDSGRPSYPMIFVTKPDRAILEPGAEAVSSWLQIIFMYQYKGNT